MTRTIEYNFSHLFNGIIWNTVVTPEEGILIIEVRNKELKRVTFSALSTGLGNFLWKDIAFDEPWWISLNAAAKQTAIFTIYLENNNPDKKGIFAYDITAQKVMWWNNDFSLVAVNDRFVRGIASKYGVRELTLELGTGVETSAEKELLQSPDGVLRPFQYTEDSSHFITIKTFLSSRFNLLPVSALEYLEYDALIFLSFYVQEGGLANYLMIISDNGDLLMKEKLDEQLKGIGLDTFFLYGDSVFFVKNKRELFSYKIV
ncbi:MAG TPA: DUF4905 domain-containing protein [Chryseolinea sp.]|nr:DUF4905 domain-containing protein [Chryseolinea sp.]